MARIVPARSTDLRSARITRLREQGRPPASPLRTALVGAGFAAIILLGAAFWASLGVLFLAWKDTQSTLPALFPTPVISREVAPEPPGGVPPPSATATPTPATLTPTSTPRAQSTPTPVLVPAVPATATPTLEPGDGGRAPWVLLPQPAPGARVAAGRVSVEARGRGDAPIVEIRLEVDDAPVPVTLEQRSESIWRAAASVVVGPGTHTVRATVIDERGRSGAYRWTFEAASP